MKRALVVIAVASCTNGHATHALYDPTSSDFYATPFPNDLRRHPDGTLDLSLFPSNSLLVDQYRQAAQTLDGFGLNAAMFVRFDGAIDPASLPDPVASEQTDASVYVVNVDARSPQLGGRKPIIATFRSDGTNTIGGNRLVVRPYPGFSLDEGTTYALVVTNRVRDTAAKPIAASPTWQTVIRGGGSAAERAVYAPLLAWLDTPPDGARGPDTRADVVDAAVFTTQHATLVAPALRKGVFGTPAPTVSNLIGSFQTDLSTWTGDYVAPNFQTGDVPYLNGGGEIQIGADGAAIVQRMEPMRFALTVPLGPPPATGWPICIYQHGTGGDYMSFIQDGTADRLALQKIAVISTDQVLHGPRNPGGDPEVDFFNFANPYAGRDNALQGAADAWSQLRLALGMSFSDGQGHTETFDRNRVMFFGHSQGGLTGPGFIAFEPAVTGVVLSGTGGLLYLSALHKTMPVDFPSLLETLSRDLPMDEDNPSLALLQLWEERADGVNYARLFVRNPPPSGTFKNVFQSEGFVDTFAPNPAIEAFATAVGGWLVKTPDEMDVAGLTQLGDGGVIAPPITDPFPQGPAVTAVLAQYAMRPGSDGHFVVFEVPAAEAQSAQFLGTLAATGRATVVPYP